MSEGAAAAMAEETVETVLRAELAQGDAVAGSINPILRHLLANDDHSVFSDEIVARTRAMLTDLATQLLDALARANGIDDRVQHDADKLSALVASFVDQPALLGHLHAVALEWQLIERMQARLALDPVLSPLLQTLIATPEGGVAGQAIGLLAAQARFAQNCRRMQMPLNELPAEHFHAALLTLQAGAGPEGEGAAALALAELRGKFDESRSRLGLIVQMVTGMGGGATAALSIGHAGVGMFLSALALASGQDRDLTVLSTNEGQLARFALALRSAGLRQDSVTEQFGALHPEVELPEGFADLGADRAAALLAASTAVAGG